MTFLAFPNVLLDGQPERLEFSARLYSQMNTIIPSGQVQGMTALVAYRRLERDSHPIREVWLLTPEEAARVPRPPIAITPN